jgi:hypothetical protein
MRHAALRAQKQHIIWQEVIMKPENTSWPPPCQKKTITIFRCVTFKKVIKKKATLAKASGLPVRATSSAKRAPLQELLPPEESTWWS